MTFQRARSKEQREIRRRVILDTAAAMLDEMPVGEVSLNELSRRVGLAKSNVLRYFESREAVLLELLDRAVRLWVADVVDELAGASGGGAAERGDRLAAVFSASLQRHPVLCDLLSAQPGVLEHNASVEVVVDFKRSSLINLATLAEAVRAYLPELGVGTEQVCLLAIVIGAAMWSHTQHSASALAAYEMDPRLCAMRLDFPVAVESALATIIAGTLVRAIG